MIEEVILGVELIEYCVCIALMAGSEDDDLPVLLHLLEEGNGIGTNIEANLERRSINVDSKLYVWRTLALFKAVDECFI